MAEPTFGDATAVELRRRGHEVVVFGQWAIGRLTAAARDADGLLRAAATPRLMQAYSIGRQRELILGGTGLTSPEEVGISLLNIRKFSSSSRR